MRIPTPRLCVSTIAAVVFSIAIVDSPGMSAPGGDDSPAFPSAEIFRSDDAIQCEVDSGMSVDQALRQLADANIPVSAASCGEKSGEQVIAVCGARTNTIHVFTIGAGDLEAARYLGFAETTELPHGHDNARWHPIDCR
jgi:hypothetical protein